MISGNVYFRSLTTKSNNSRDLLPKMLNSNPRIMKHPCFRAKTIRPSWPRGTITGLLKKTKIQQVHIHYCGISGSGGLRDLGQSINYRVLTHQEDAVTSTLWPFCTRPNMRSVLILHPTTFLVTYYLTNPCLFLLCYLKYTMQRATIL